MPKYITAHSIPILTTEPRIGISIVYTIFLFFEFEKATRTIIFVIPYTTNVPMLERNVIAVRFLMDNRPKIPITVEIPIIIQIDVCGVKCLI